MLRLLKIEPMFVEPNKVFSKIRLQGKWLREAGFEPDTQAVVKVEPGKIIILATNREDALRELFGSDDYARKLGKKGYLFVDK